MSATPVILEADDFEFSSYTAGSEGIVGTVQVPTTQVWQVPVGSPIVCALVARQTVTVTSGSTESKTLDPSCPIVDYLPDPTAGEYDPEAFLAAYFDSSGDGDKDTLVTGSTDTQFTGTFGTSDDFVTSVEFEETTGGGDSEVDVYTVVWHGSVTLQKRSSGKSNVIQELQTEDAVTHAFQNPDAPDADRQLRWDPRNSDTRGILPPKFYLDVVYYDTSFTTAVEESNATNVEIALPLNQRPVKDDEDPATLRAKVRADMSNTGR